ncbi:hypothetical protein BGZ82_008041 [Podila clonocystis]|nr:hypothetical protein BGZ82_008041 [Podila clonocystis]
MTHCDTPNPSPLAQYHLASLKDRKTQDFIFTFKHPETHLLVCLFAHQDRLAFVGSFARRFQIPQPRGWRDSPLGRRANGAAAKFNGSGKVPYKTVVGFLLANCAMLRYIYTGEVTCEVDLRDFSFTAGDDRTPADRKATGKGFSGFLDELLSVPVRVAKKEDIIEAATIYELPDLAKRCKKEM